MSFSVAAGRTLAKVEATSADITAAGGTAHALAWDLAEVDAVDARVREAETLAGGGIDILVGTHAVFQKDVVFHDLRLAIVDEQHRFGVEQRDSLRSKTREGISPHVLVMTATPIPRTIAMTIFGDLAVSTLAELPAAAAFLTAAPLEAVADGPQGFLLWLDRALARMLRKRGF